MGLKDGVEFVVLSQGDVVLAVSRVRGRRRVDSAWGACYVPPAKRG
ncbi:MAG: hypothetical protein HY897_00755 [Deltaproteobacteria bacterium]|nr:hypothetical protein [Deltaproteobacteria bacterium]